MRSKSYCVPASGAVVKFGLDCLGAPKETQEYNSQHLKRLAEGKGLSAEMRERKMRSLVDAIVGVFSGEDGSQGTADRVLKEWRTDPFKYVTWQYTPEGEFRDLCDHLVGDLLEFLKRHEFLVSQFGAGEADREMLWIWCKRFVVPLLAVNAVEYRVNYSGLERGMPPGGFWYLPALTCSVPNCSEKEMLDWLEGSPKSTATPLGLPDLDSEDLPVKLPVPAVLEWWQDLLGSPLESLAGELCAMGPGKSLETARRQVNFWLKGARPPAAVTIVRWCGRKWKYNGALEKLDGLSANEGWCRCREFLTKKGLDAEKLEREIPTFSDVPLQAFFDAADPIGQGLPVEQFVGRIVERYSPPSPEQLKARLFWAAAFQRAFRAAKKAMGGTRAWKLVAWYRTIGGTLTNILHLAERPTKLSVLDFLRRMPPEHRFLREVLEPLFRSDEKWQEMVSSTIAADMLEARLACAAGS